VPDKVMANTYLMDQATERLPVQAGRPLRTIGELLQQQREDAAAAAREGSGGPHQQPAASGRDSGGGPGGAHLLGAGLALAADGAVWLAVSSRALSAIANNADSSGAAGLAPGGPGRLGQLPAVPAQQRHHVVGPEADPGVLRAQQDPGTAAPC
jgi:hypothetical protein